MPDLGGKIGREIGQDLKEAALRIWQSVVRMTETHDVRFRLDGDGGFRIGLEKKHELETVVPIEGDVVGNAYDAG